MTVSSTSAITYHNEIKGKKENSQAGIVYKAMVQIGRACTMRELQEKTGLEINVVSRSLNYLRTKEKKIEYFDAKDKHNRRVHHYRVILTEGKQTNLF